MKLSIITIWLLFITRRISAGKVRKPGQAPCDLDCQKFGYCVRLTKHNMLEDKENLQPPMKCVCPHDNQGILCDMNKNCDDAQRSSQEAKSQCLEPKTVYCNGVDAAISKNCFCTNGGTCREYKSPDDE